METLVELWDASRSHPQKRALVHGSRIVSHGQLARQVDRLGAAIHSRWACAPGDIVALFAPNCVEFVPVYFALVRLGLTVQPLDGRLVSAELKALLADSGSRHLIVHESVWSRIQGPVSELPQLEHVLGIGDGWDPELRMESWIESASDEPVRVALGPDQIAELMYTSGTTSEPKGVMRSHRNVCAAVLRGDQAGRP